MSEEVVVGKKKVEDIGFIREQILWETKQWSN